MNKIITVVGARPQFVKAAVVSKALSKVGIKEEIIHTGQHYDYEMSTVFWDELNIPATSINLEVGSGHHGTQTGVMMQKIEEYVLNSKDIPKLMLVYGDTNSTLAGALVASKLNIPIVHVEAGLRSFNREMPEEINRVLTDHISSLLFCSSDEGVTQLESEGIKKGVYNVGDVMYDALKTFSEIAEKKFTLSDVTELKKSEFILTTIHRPSNTDNEHNLSSIFSAFEKLQQQILWPVHPRNRAKLSHLQVPNNVHLIEPVSYFKMLVLLKNCSKVITDSGGLQKEAYWMKKPCITIREETEWVETLEGGWNNLTGANTQKIIKAVNSSPNTPWKTLYGKGDASDKIATQIQSKYF